MPPTRCRPEGHASNWCRRPVWGSRVPSVHGLPSSVGEYNWIGIQGTSFWVDPEEDLVGVFMVQIRPNRDITFRDQFKRLVYQALIG